MKVVADATRTSISQSCSGSERSSEGYEIVGNNNNNKNNNNNSIMSKEKREDPAVMSTYFIEERDAPEFNDKMKECDYDVDPPKLYVAIQSKNWDLALKYASKTSDEGKTWIYRTSPDSGKLRWKLLPLHAAVIFKAPEHVVRAVMGNYPPAVRCRDDQGMLPIHLSFRNGSSIDVINMILLSFPECIQEKDRKGRIPLTLAQASMSPNRKAFMEALERGPAYYAEAAVVSTRVTVTQELTNQYECEITAMKLEMEQKMTSNIQMYETKVSLLEKNLEQTELRETHLNEELASCHQTQQQTKEALQDMTDKANYLEQQLNDKTQSEQSLKLQVADLAKKLNQLADATTGATSAYDEKVRKLEAERRELRDTVQDKTRKLIRVATVVDTMASEQDHIAYMATKHEETMMAATAAQEQLLMDSKRKEKIMLAEAEERKKIIDILNRQAEAFSNAGSVRELFNRQVNIHQDQMTVCNSERTLLVERVKTQKNCLQDLVDTELASVLVDIAKAEDAMVMTPN